MVKYLLILGIFSTFSVNAQKEGGNYKPAHLEPVYYTPGLLEGSATLSPGIMLNRADNNYYVSGFLEYHFDLYVYEIYL